MSLNLRAILILFLSPLLAFAQSGEPRIQTEVELASVLCRAHEDEQSREQLLKSHPQLVNNQLWSALSRSAFEAYHGPSPEQSLAIYEIALQVASQLHSQQLLGKTYYNIGRAHSGLDQLSKAVEAYEKSRRVFEQAGLQRDLSYIFADLGRLYFLLEDYEKAKSYSEQSLAQTDTTGIPASPGTPPDEFTKATALATLADLHLRDGDYEQAVQNLRTALVLHEQLNRENSRYQTFIADDHQTLGRLYTASGDFTQALIHLSQALKIVKSLADPDAMASLLNSIGILYLEQEDYSQAKRSLDDSLQIYLSISKHKEAAKVLLNLGVIEQRQSNYEQALTQFRLSLQAAKATLSIDGIIAAGEGISVVLTARKDFVGALEILNESLALAKQAENKTRQTEVLWRSAETYYAMGNYAQAVIYAESAADLARASHLSKLLYLATTTLGQSYAAQKKLELATQTLKQATDQIEAMRDHVAGTEVESQLFLENKVAAYRSLVDLFVKQDKPIDGLLAAERAKGRVLLDVLSNGKVDFAKAITESEKIEERRLNGNIVALNIQISQESSKKASDDALLNRLNEQLGSARLRYEAFQDSLYAYHPELRLSSGRLATLTVEQISKLLTDDKAAILEYVVTTEKTYLFVLTRGQQAGVPALTVYQINVADKELAQQAHRLRDMLAEQSPVFADKTHELYDVLIKPAADQLRDKKTICIIPDGPLWDLPFQTLQSKDDRYLLEDYVLYYAPSLGVLRQMSQRQKPSERGSASLIAFGNPRIGNDIATNLKAALRGESLAALPEAETEVKALREIWGARRSKVLIGPDAGKTVFKAEAGKYQIIHLATHGLLDDNHPMYSRLVMARNENDPDDDGLLEAREIMQLNLRADLVVLSACQTARGRVGAGEGIIGMSWAFLAAGAPTIVVSQWKVDSAATATLMINFYRRLAKQTPKRETAKADALRQAALDLLRQPKYRHPFYWASFVMLGDGT